MAKTSVVIDAAGAATAANADVQSQKPAAQRPVHFTEKDVADPKSLAELLTKMWANIDEVTRSWRASPLVESIEFRNLTVTSGTNISLRHGFGRYVRWAIVDAGSNAPGFVRASASDDNTLVLSPTATGTASVLVF